MTVSYNYDVCTASLTTFIRLLFRWRGSVWKLVIRELFLWTVLYLIISFIYRSPYVFSVNQKETFRNLALYIEKYLKTINLTFILGFFVSVVTTRWTTILVNMGYIESNALFIGSYIKGDDDETRLIRRTIVRYLCLAQVMVFRDINVRVRKRFPTMESLITAGYLLPHEKEKLESYNLKYDKYWVPIKWATTHVFICRKTTRIGADILVNKIMDEIKVFRTNLQMLCNYDWVPLPLVYPQVICVAVYFYFAVCLISRQYVDFKNRDKVDLILPFMTMLQYLFFVGWMKVALVLLNPLGEDDDDFECNFLLDKNLATSLLIVDKCSGDAPTVTEDIFYNCEVVEPLYPESNTDENRPLIGSAAMADVISVNEEALKPSSSIKKRNSVLQRFTRQRNTIHCMDSSHAGRRNRNRTRSEGPPTPSKSFDFGVSLSHSVSCPIDPPLETNLGTKLPFKQRVQASRRSSNAPSNVLSTVIEEELLSEKPNFDGLQTSPTAESTSKPLRRKRQNLKKAVSASPYFSTTVDEAGNEHRKIRASRSVSFTEPF